MASHADEHELSSLEHAGRVGREAKAILVAVEELGEAGFMDRHPPGLEVCDARGFHVANDHLVTEIGEAGGGDQPTQPAPMTPSGSLRGQPPARRHGPHLAPGKAVNGFPQALLQLDVGLPVQHLTGPRDVRLPQLGLERQPRRSRCFDL